LIGLFSIPLANADALGDKIREDILRKIAEDDARLRDGIPKEDPMLANGWVTDQPTFNYKLPCDLDKTPSIERLLIRFFSFYLPFYGVY
jgi:hypothetical protein